MSLDATKKANDSSLYDDYKEEETMSDINDLNKVRQDIDGYNKRHLLTYNSPHPPNDKISVIDNNSNHSNNTIELHRPKSSCLQITDTSQRNWFNINDKLDILHDQEWYRATIRDVDGYSIYVEFQDENGNNSKWIKNCNQIFKYICQCTVH